ncbi:hypothetical protein MNBD_NITROSPINAE01-1002 [hydrothermal vent metagenome]|uniref:Fe-S-cluster oxidoreductase n=1 Tax=hydrothermal vent metagenome TaxID=652676 RepID=A0A3B1C361_9ZZZZ
MKTATCLDEMLASRAGSDAYSNYKKFVEHLDTRVSTLKTRHNHDMKCGVGCDSCCLTSRSVLPVEGSFILKALRRLDGDFRGKLLEFAQGNLNVCPMLLGGVCSIYESRPVICRTHGLPLLVDTGEEIGVDYCQSNFADRDHAEPFDGTEVMDTLELNANLRRINEEFIGSNLTPETRIDILDILNHSTLS